MKKKKLNVKLKLGKEKIANLETIKGGTEDEGFLSILGKTCNGAGQCVCNTAYSRPK